MPRKKVQPEIEQTSSDVASTKASSKSFPLQTILIVLAFLLMLGIITLLYQQVQKANQELNTLKQQQAEQKPADETTSLLEELAQILVLPENETPTIATVTDTSKLGNQPFFAGAAVGDRVIIYSQSKKAILYRPSDQKVINIAPLTDEITQDNPDSASSPDQTTNE